MVMEDPELEFAAAAVMPANSNDCVVSFISICSTLLYSQNLSHKWQSKTTLHHCIKSDSLLGFVVRVHDRFRDEQSRWLYSGEDSCGGVSSRAAFLRIAHMKSRRPPQSVRRQNFRQEVPFDLEISSSAIEFPKRCNQCSITVSLFLYMRASIGTSTSA